MDKLNKLGYSKIEVLIVILLLGIVAFITINKTSYAFADNNEEAIKEIDNLIEIQAADYASANLYLFDEVNTTYISVEDLIESGYLLADEDGYLTDPTDSSKKLNDKKVKLECDENKSNIVATVVD